MNRSIRLAPAALTAAALTVCLVLGCGADDGPGYLKNPGDAPPLSADEHASAAAEDRAVADAERAAAAPDLPKSTSRSKR